MSISASQLPIIPARYYLRLLKLLMSRNIPIQEVLETLNIDIEKYLAIPDIKLSLYQVESFIQFALKYPENYDLAFELGRSIKLTSHHLVGYAVQTSQTLEEALKLVSLYFSLVIPNFKVSYAYNKEGFCEIHCEPIIQMSVLTLNFHLEAIGVAVHCNISELLNRNLPAYHIFSSIQEPLHSERYNQLHPAKFHFGVLSRPGVHFLLPGHIIKYELPLADEFTLQAIERKCQEQLSQITHQQNFVEWVELMLMDAYQMPQLSDCAKLLNISTKTLQRYLKQHGADFHQIKRKVQMQKAKTLLIQPEYTITKIAYDIGYSSTSNFSRAFKQWQGISPEQYREKVLSST